MIRAHVSIIEGPDNMPNCKFPGCSKKVLLVPYNYPFFDHCIEQSFKKREWEKKKKQLRDASKHAATFTGLEYCEEHEIYEYQHILDYVFTYNVENKPDMKTFLFFKQCEHRWNVLYTELCRNQKDNLLISCRDAFYREKSKVPKNKSSNLERKSEFLWFTDLNYYSIPWYWKKNYQVFEYFGVTSQLQGKFNGPDFIFTDKKTKEKIGFEIFELNPTVFDISKIKNVDKFISKMDEQIKERGGTLYKCLRTAIYELDRKIEKWNKYVETDKRNVGIIINETVPDEWYIFLELILNNMKRYHDFFNWIYLL